MSVPSPYTQRTYPNNVRCKVVSEGKTKENCRDYLRTGRCKYGASCKYNHPPNVQSGGGMKAPIDPSEPLFPIRYNEPVCQYYMKHGTCKFGQACKFHHPPQVAGTGTGTSNLMNGNTLLVSIPLGRKEDGTQTIWKTGNDSSIQFLPQRPDEPNCLYFLKHGRCKYGASCRYHHPLNYNNDRRGGVDDGRCRHHQDYRGAPKVHYVTALPPSSMQQGHFVVADGTVTFLSLDGNTPAHVVSIPQSTSNSGAKDSNSLHTAPATIASSISSTSIASSFETPISNIEALESSGSLWSRKASGNTNGAYGLPRVVSTGSSQNENNNNNNNSVYFIDANSGPPAWRGARSSSFDHTRPRSSSLSNNQDEDLPRSASVQSELNDHAGSLRSLTKSPSIINGKTNHPNPRSQRPQGEVDEGLSMMASALLTMIDTPEEAATTGQVHQGYECDEQSNTYPCVQPVSRGKTIEDSNEYQDHSTYYGQHPAYRQGHNLYNEEFPSDAYSPGHMTFHQEGQGQEQVNQIDRIQSWQGSASAGVIHENSQFSSMDPSQQSASSPNSSTNNNVGLFY